MLRQNKTERGEEMRLELNEKKSVEIIKVVMAITTVFLPFLTGLLNDVTATYLLLTVFCGVFAIRLIKSAKAGVSVLTLIGLCLTAYSVLSSLWVDNREGHMLYVSGLLLTAVFTSVLTDYYVHADNTTRRFSYMLTMSGVVCAAGSMCDWLINIVPYGNGKNLTFGFENSEFLAIFMLLSIISSVSLLKNNARTRKIIIRCSLVLMVFVFFLTAGFVAWMLVILTAVLLVVRNFYTKLFFPAGLCAVVVFSVTVISVALSGGRGIVFREVYGFGIESFFGNGGGFFAAKEIFLSVPSTETTSGLLAYITAASGVFGLGVCVILFIINAISFNKLRDFPSLFALLVTVPLMFLPFGGICTILFYFGLMLFNISNWKTGAFRTVTVRQKMKVKRMLVASFAVLAMTVPVLTGNIVANYADMCFKDGEFSSAFDFYKVASSINLTDAHSCYMAVISMKNGNLIQNNSQCAHEMIDKAIEREPDNLKFRKEKALLYELSGEYDKAAKLYSDAARRAKTGDEYNLMLAKVLFHKIEEYPKGSIESRNIHNEISQLAGKTDNIEIKKEINDIADKAQPFTKGEIIDEK